jgi:hypothetical protein
LNQIEDAKMHVWFLIQIIRRPARPFPVQPGRPSIHPIKVVMAHIRRLRFFRWLTGLPWNVTLNDCFNEAQGYVCACLTVYSSLTHNLDPSRPS